MRTNLSTYTLSFGFHPPFLKHFSTSEENSENGRKSDTTNE